jgi:poly(3-hydroxybutyrate) depolymerase
MPISRREFAAALAAPALTAAGLDDALVRRHDEAVDRMVRQQVTDPASPGVGGSADESGLFHAGTGAGLLEAFMAAWACPQSRHHPPSWRTE